jgi:TM2 domain-containing membrane protein YozV
MRKLIIFGIVLCTLSRLNASADVLRVVAYGDTLPLSDSLVDSAQVINRSSDNPAPEESFKKKKLITAILAFPVPFGFVGMHRIYLGSEPWVPIVYLITGGGGVGLLPLVDFMYIITANEEEFKKYENNPRVFMFVE